MSPAECSRFFQPLSSLSFVIVVFLSLGVVRTAPAEQFIFVSVCVDAAMPLMQGVLSGCRGRYPSAVLL